MTVILCAQAKGGVGNSLLATNLAYLLAEKKKRVLLLDANKLSDIPSLFAIKSGKNVANLWEFFREGSEKISSKKIRGFFNKTVYAVDNLDVLLADSEQRFSGMKHYREILTYAKKIYDFIVIDSGANNFKLLTALLANLDLVLLTTTPDRTALDKTLLWLEKTRGQLEENGLEIDLIVNQADGFQKKEMETIFALPCQGILPRDNKTIWENVNWGVPAVSNRRSPWGRALEKLTAKLLREKNA